MKRTIVMLLAMVALHGSVGQAKADYLFNFSYTETDGLNSPPVMVVGSLLATSNGDGSYLATSGTATVTGDPSIISPVSLLPNYNGFDGTYYGYPINYTPDNYLYPGGILIDLNGLIFSDTAGDLINIYEGYYYVSDISPYPYTNGLFGTFTLTAVPEPSGLALFGMGVVCLAVGYAARRWKLAPTAA